MKSFNKAAESIIPTKLTTQVEIGWEHDIVSDESGDTVVFQLDSKGHRVPRRYTVPVTLTAAETLHRAQGISPAVAAKLAEGDLEALLEVVDSFVGGGVVQQVGTDPTVSTAEFMEFVGWLVDELGLVDVFGSSGN